MKKRLIGFVSFLFALYLLASLPVRAEAEGTAPTAESMELRVCRNGTVAGRLSAADPDGDLAGFLVTTGPVKGALALASDGSFLYTPQTNRRGWDYFGYKARDTEGNLSQEATVIIKIEK